jgi:hypothetical protein
MKGRNWDRASLPPEEGKVFVLEDKGTTAVTRTRKMPLQTHRIDIGAAQLNWYCDEVERADFIPVYYVLPRPPWNGSAALGMSPSRQHAGLPQMPARLPSGHTLAAAPTCAANSLDSAA